MRTKQPGKVSAMLAGVILVGTGILKGMRRSGVELPVWLLTAAVILLAIVAAAYLIAVFREGKGKRKKGKTNVPALLASVLTVLLILIQWLARVNSENPVFLWVCRGIGVVLLLLFAAYIAALLRAQSDSHQKILVLLQLLGVVGGFGAAFYSLLLETESMWPMDVFFVGIIVGILCLRLLLRKGKTVQAAPPPESDKERQLETWLKNGLIDKEEYKVLKARHERDL